MKNIEGLRLLSPHDLAYLGIDDVAYVRNVIVNGQSGVSVHAADGTPIAVLPDKSVAFATIRQHDLQPVSVH